MEAVVAIAIAENVLYPIKRHLSYIFQLDSHVQILEEVVVQLKSERDRVKQSVDEATGNGEEISVDVISWLRVVGKEITDAEEVIQGKEEAKQKCCVGVSPNLNARHRLGKKAHKKASVISSLVWDAERFLLISLDRPVKQVVEPSVFAREALPSRLHILEQIMDTLKDPRFTMIGVHGEEGVGKTTLVKEVQAKAIQEKMFANVLLVAVSQTTAVRRIQTEIADFLGMEFDAVDLLARASELHRRLVNSNVLIILDDLRYKLDLDAVGIPSGNGCKLLLTSREVDVLCVEMGTEKEFPLHILEDEEAWQLFCALVPKSLDPQFKEIATKLCEKCAGLPLSINIAAKELQNKDLNEWKNVLKQISMFRIEGLQAWKGMSKQQSMLRNKGTHRRVNNFLATSSENQQEEEMKSLLLLCLMFAPSNIEIQRLLMYSMGSGMFKHTETVRGARDRLLALINKLKDESLLFDGDLDGFVKMDDADRNAAISFASTLHRFFVGSGQVQFGDQLDRNCTKISLPYCDVSELPSSLDCPDADLFLLFSKDQGLKMPHSFFERMKNLKVVDFTGMRFTSLPPSLGLLTNLRALRLQKCQLHDVSLIGKLKQLQQLSFAYSRIVTLPKEIRELNQLKLLDLSNCTMLQVIAPDILSKLSHLEELYMLASFHRWGAKGNASLVELKNLDQLSALEIQIENPKLIPGGMGFFDGLELKHIRIFVSNEGVGDGDIRDQSGRNTVPRDKQHSDPSRENDGMSEGSMSPGTSKAHVRPERMRVRPKRKLYKWAKKFGTVGAK